MIKIIHGRNVNPSLMYYYYKYSLLDRDDLYKVVQSLINEPIGIILVASIAIILLTAIWMGGSNND